MLLKRAWAIAAVAAILVFAVVLTAQSRPDDSSAQALTGKTAEQVYKDIQVLKGTPADQLMPAMEFMNISLGVQCEYCHLPGAYDSPQSYKTVARDMIKMQSQLTTGIFENARLATCWTCHRGSPDPATIPPVAAGNEPPVRVEEELGIRVTITPELLFGKWIVALGGAAALSKITSRVERGTISFGSMKSPIEVLTKSPDRRMSIAHAPDGESITAFDGHSGWLGTVGRGAKSMAPDENYAAMLDAALAFPLTAQKAFARTGMWRPAKVNGREMNVVLGSNRGQPAVKLYFDKETGLLTRMERFVETPVGQIETDVDYGDYRSESGVKMPFRWTIARPQTRFTIQIERVQQNVSLADSIFNKPEGTVPAPKIAASNVARR